MKITMAHGSGGSDTSKLIEEIFTNNFHNELEDSAIVKGCNNIAVTTDSFVVSPMNFPGGDIGRLAVCGTVNDLLMRASKPEYLTCGFILQEGLDTDVLKQIVESMAKTAKEANVRIVAGDTKVVEGDGGIYINTAGIGFVQNVVEVSAANCKCNDDIIISGNLGEHHAAILSKRMGIENSIESDCAPLCDMVNNLIINKIKVHAMRDVTRGGLATVLNELAEASNVLFEITESKLPVSAQVEDLCGLLGLEPLFMGNEGKMVAVVAHEDSEKALKIIKASKYGENAAIIGRVIKDTDSGVTLITDIGGKRQLGVLEGEGLPRIC